MRSRRALCPWPPSRSAPARPPRRGAPPRVRRRLRGRRPAGRAHPADGVELTHRPRRGRPRQARCASTVDFMRGGGYAVARKAFDLDLPANYRFRFAIKGDMPSREPRVQADRLDRRERVVVHAARLRRSRRSGRRVTTGSGRSVRVGTDRRRRDPARRGDRVRDHRGHGGKGTVWLDDARAAPCRRQAPRCRRSRARPRPRWPCGPLAVDADSTSYWWARPPNGIHGSASISRASGSWAGW